MKINRTLNENQKEAKDVKDEGDEIKVRSYNVTLKIDIGEVFSIDCFQNKKDDRDIRFYTNYYFTNYIRNIEKTSRYWLVTNSYYHKK